MRIVIVILGMLMLLSGCGVYSPDISTDILTPASDIAFSAISPDAHITAAPQSTSRTTAETPADEKTGVEDTLIYAYTDAGELAILPADNTSAKAFIERLKQNDLTISMRDYGGFEKVGALGFELPTNDVRITTQPGDVILYQGDQITIYYAENTWSFTRLGRVLDITQAELLSILGDSDVEVRFTLQRVEPLQSSR